MSISLIACTKTISEDDFIKKAQDFHVNYNENNYCKNYKILKKNSGMSALQADYERSFIFVKSRLGNFKSVTLLNVNFAQTTSTGKKLIRVSFDSEFELGVAKEFFYFSESGDLYRHEIFSKNFLDKET